MDNSSPTCGTSQSAATLVFTNADSMLGLAALSADGRIKIYARAQADIIIDVVGYYGETTDTWNYTYAPDGIRRNKSGPDVDVSYQWDRSSPLPMLLSETTTNVGTTYFIYGPAGLPIEQINADNSVYFLHHDQLGSTRMITDVSGNAVATISYDAYGNESARSSNASSPFGFAGQYSDAESGYQYLRARYYDPTTGQFLNRDPIEAITRSAYGYVYGNPLNATDPSGLWCITGVNKTASERAGHQVCNGVKEVAKSTAVTMIDSTPVVPGCPINVGQFRRVAAWQWSHPDQHADVMQWVGAAASATAVFGAASGNAPVAGIASGVATIASGVEMVQGIRANEPEHIVVGGVGLVTAGFGSGASVMATGLGAGRVTQTIIAILELWIGAGSSELVDG